MANCGLKTKTEAIYKTTQISNGERQNNAMQIMKSLLSANLGLTDYMAAGIVGNMWAESRWNPTSYIPKDSGEGQSGGLCHWHDTENGNGRFSNLLNFAKTNNKNWQDMQLQMTFLLKELTRTQNKALTEVKGTSNVDEATTMFCRYFERASLCYPSGTPTERIIKAKEVLEKWNKQHPL